MNVYGEEYIFKDFSVNDEYYEDVKFFYDKGIIKGQKDDLFHPKELITIAEVITITEKVIGDKNNLPEDWSWWQNPEYNNPNIKIWKHDWNFPGLLIKDGYLSSASRNTIACILLNIAKEPIVVTEPWGLNSKDVFDYVIYYNNMRIRGFWEDEQEGYIGVSRAEFCHILRRFLNDKELSKPSKEIFVKINQKYKENRTETEKIEDYYRIYNFITKVPDNVQKLFNKKGYSFYYVDDAYWEKHLKDIDFAGGVYNHPKYRKSIVIRQQNEETVLHEFAHFIEEYYYEYYSQTKKIYNEDKKEINNKLMLITKNTYCNTSAQEYFAEGFAMYFVENQKMKELLPELYKIYDELILKIKSLDI
jgi:hypothetical protein